MGYLERRGQNSWRIRTRINVGGKQMFVGDTLRFPPAMPEDEQRQRAQEALDDLEADVAAGNINAAKPELTLRQFSELYVTEYLRPSTSPNNVKTVTNLLEKRILPELGALPLRQLTPIRITRFINKLKTSPKAQQALPPDQRVRRPADPEKLAEEMEAYHARQEKLARDPETLSARSVHHYYQTLNALLQKAVQWDYLSINPMDKVDAPKFRKCKMQYLTDEQAVDLLRKLSKEENMSFRCAVLLALLCGLRLGEVGALTFQDVDFEQGSINVSHALKYTPETGNFVGDTKSFAGERVVDLPPGMVALLDETRKYHEYAKSVLGDRWHGTGRIVCAWDGAPLSHDTPSKQWRKFADRNGFVGIRFHELRHTHATILLANNIDAVAVASRLGHADATVTLQTYAHALRRRDRESATTMQHLIDAAHLHDKLI
ncbi:MAG: tyrosine-type recombinase/integrase [Eubacteriales bacterium]|nr:tyrosine-type recombinase/integrase [Eubacteriales bacterium]